MAKKVRRVRKKKNIQAVEAPAAAPKSLDKDDSGKMTSDEIFRQEYTYVIKDLQRVLLVSGAMFILLIVLNLLLQA